MMNTLQAFLPTDWSTPSDLWLKNAEKSHSLSITPFLGSVVEGDVPLNLDIP
jgi:hypothetical protein